MSVAVTYTDDGPREAPVIVFGGSIGSTTAMWDNVLDPIVAAGFRVVRYNHRGHGGSPAPAGPYTMTELADDVRALLDRLDIERACLTGLSLGAMTGMALARRHPERVSGLVLCCTAAKFDTVDLWVDRSRLVRAEGLGALAPKAVTRWVRPSWAAAHPERMAELEAMLAGNDAEGYASCCDAIAAMDLTGDLAALSAPTLVIACTDDEATPPRYGRVIAEGITAARLELVADAAHVGNLEQPRRFAELITEHARTLS